MPDFVTLVCVHQLTKVRLFCRVGAGTGDLGRILLLANTCTHCHAHKLSNSRRTGGGTGGEAARISWVGSRTAGQLSPMPGFYGFIRTFRKWVSNYLTDDLATHLHSVPDYAPDERQIAPPTTDRKSRTGRAVSLDNGERSENRCDF
jgi:hypothetical protein